MIASSVSALWLLLGAAGTPAAAAAADPGRSSHALSTGDRHEHERSHRHHDADPQQRRRDDDRSDCDHSGRRTTSLTPSVSPPQSGNPARIPPGSSASGGDTDVGPYDHQRVSPNGAGSTSPASSAVAPTSPRPAGPRPPVLAPPSLTIPAPIARIPGAQVPVVLDAVAIATIVVALSIAVASLVLVRRSR